MGLGVELGVWHRGSFALGHSQEIWSLEWHRAEISRITESGDKQPSEKALKIGKKMKTIESMCHKSQEQTLVVREKSGLFRLVCCGGLRAWEHSRVQVDGKDCTCSQREKPRFPYSLGDRKKSCPIFGMENKSGLDRNNVASLWRKKSNLDLTFKALLTWPPCI